MKNLIPFPVELTSHVGSYQKNTTIIEVDFKKKRVKAIREIDNVNDVEVRHTHKHEAVRDFNRDLERKRA